LAAALVAVLGFRWLCGCGWTGLARQLRACALFALIAGLLGLPHPAAAEWLGRAIELFLRLSVALLPALAFSSTLDTRELAWCGRRWVPPEVLLASELALRFAPVLAREALDVLALQRARGAFRRGPLSRRAGAVLLPFFARVFHIADRVAHVLRMRGVEPERRRAVVPPEALRRALFELRRPSPEVSRGHDA
jgi:energy-coupling factor transporter transmembrane protein EcfT